MHSPVAATASDPAVATSLADSRAGAVVAVVVSYRPEPGRLAALLAALAPQVAAVVVVDNGSPDDISACLPAAAGKAELLPLGDNLGIAVAQNRGIGRARQLGAEAVLLLDQDSEPAGDMVPRLLAALRQRQAAGIPVAAVGPRYLDRHGRASEPFVRRRGLLIGRCPCRDDDEVPAVDFLIASGSLIPLATLDRVGPMEEALFIDYVDTEWMIRAGSLGYQAFGVCGAHMGHSLGDAVATLCGRPVTLRSPLRHYYMFRNAVWLYRRPGVPAAWKVADALRLVQRFFAYALLAKPRRRQLAMMLRGLADGWRGRMGRFEER